MPDFSPTLILILAVVVLAVLFAGLRYALWWRKYRSVRKLLEVAFSPSYADTYLGEYFPLSYSLTFHGKEPVEEIQYFFLKEAFSKDYFAYRTFLILGEGGAGKTQLLVHLLASYHLQWRKPYHIAFHTCHEVGVLSTLVAYPSPEKTILLLDGLDEDGRGMTDFKKRIDELLAATANFAKVIISSNHLYLNQYVAFSDQEEYVRLEGAEQSALFLTLFLLPLSHKQQLKLFKKHSKAFSFQPRLRLKAILSQTAELFEKPVLWQYTKFLVEEEAPLKSENQAWERIINRWASHNSMGMPSEKVREQDSLLELLVFLAYDMFTQVERRGGYFIPEAQFYALLQKHGITPRKLSQEVLTHNPDGHIMFAHPSMLAHLLAKGVFMEQIPDLILGSARLPELRSFWLESIWNLSLAGFHEEEKEWGFYLDPFTEDKLSLLEIEARHFQQLTHLFLNKFRTVDLRFLKACSKLEGIYLKEANLTDLSTHFLPFLPNHEVRLFIPEVDADIQGSWQVFRKDPVDPLRLAKDTLSERKDPELPFAYSHPRPDRQIIISPENLFNLMLWELPEIPGERFAATHLSSLAGEHAPKVYEGFLDEPMAGMFDKLTARVFPGGSMNLSFSSSFSLALHENHLKEYLKKLSDVYGRDSQGLSYFTKADQIQLSQGWWQGRYWQKDLPAHIGIPLNLYMDAPGKLNAVLFGIPEIRKESAQPDDVAFEKSEA